MRNNCIRTKISPEKTKVNAGGVLRAGNRPERMKEVTLSHTERSAYNQEMEHAEENQNLWMLMPTKGYTHGLDIRPRSAPLKG